MKILIDANVALDVLLERQPFYISGVRVLGLSKGGYTAQLILIGAILKMRFSMPQVKHSL